MKRLLPLLLILPLLFSCTSLGELVRSQVEGMPAWVSSPPSRSGQVSFVGKGSATVEYNARLQAYEEILAELSVFLGEDVRAEYYRELTNTEKIADFSLQIINEHQRTDTKGVTTVYLLARADQQLVTGRRSVIYQYALERQQQISALITEADRHYRENRDTEAIAHYLQAAILASAGPVLEKKHEPSALIDRAISYVKALQISVRNAESDTIQATVQLRRKRRLISSRVLEAPIKAYFTSANSLGIRYADSLLFNTASAGSFLFLPYSQLIDSSGVITFSLFFEPEFADAEGVLDPALIAQVRDAIASVEAEFVYERAPLFGSRTLLAEVHEYAYDGSLLAGEVAVNSVAATLEGAKIAVSVVELSEEEWEDQAEELEQRYGAGHLVITGSVGVVAEDRAKDRYISVAVGQIALRDTRTGELLFSSKDVEAVGSGLTAVASRNEAFQRFGNVAASLCIAALLSP